MIEIDKTILNDIRKHITTPKATISHHASETQLLAFLLHETVQLKGLVAELVTALKPKEEDVSTKILDKFK